MCASIANDEQMLDEWANDEGVDNHYLRNLSLGTRSKTAPSLKT